MLKYNNVEVKPPNSLGEKKNTLRTPLLAMFVDHTDQQKCHANITLQSLNATCHETQSGVVSIISYRKIILREISYFTFCSKIPVHKLFSLKGEVFTVNVTTFFLNFDMISM